MWGEASVLGYRKRIAHERRPRIGSMRRPHGRRALLALAAVAVASTVFVSHPAAAADPCVPDGKPDRSIEGETHAPITFVNETSARVLVYWLDYEGNRQFWFDLDSDESFFENTWLTHPWIVTTVDGRCIGYVLADQPSQTYIITDASISLAPLSASNPVGTSHTLTATAREEGAPASGVTVTFRVVSGPNVGLTRTAVTSGSGVATTSYSSSITGTDAIEASFEGSGENLVTSNQVTKTWTQPSRTIVSAGPLEQITIRNDLGCAVVHSGAPDFNAFDGSNACGTFVAVGTTLFGPADIPGGGAAGPRTAYTPVSQSAVTGTGSAANPFRIVTVVTLGATGLRVTQTDTYVVGESAYRTSVQVTNTGTVNRSGIVYRAGDCALRGTDTGLGRLGQPAPPVACLPAPSPPAPNLVLEWNPTTPGARYYEATATELWTRIGARLAFANTCRCGENIDNAAGLSWNLSLNGGASTTLSNATNFRNDTATGTIPPGGGSVSTGATAAPTDNTVSTFTLPPGGPGATITLIERPAAPGFVGNDVQLSPFSGYNNFVNAPTWTVTFDASLGANPNGRTYISKPGQAFLTVVPPCNNTTQVTPCVLSQQVIAGGDLQVTLKIRSSDPIRRFR
jgi:hypothetical protein